MKGRKNSKSKSKSKSKVCPSDINKEETEMEMEIGNEGSDEGSEESENGKGFYACYLLCSLSPTFKGHTYIGFTVNPRRRIKQHNGHLTSGAWTTRRKRPWDMILCIYGFSSNVAALQFEWAWQHPIESLAVRKAASEFKSLSGLRNKVKLAYTMLSLPPWKDMSLVVNFFSTKYMVHSGTCPRLPKQMRVKVCSMDELPCYTEGLSYFDEEDDDIEENSSSFAADIPSKELADNLNENSHEQNIADCNQVREFDEIQSNTICHFHTKETLSSSPVDGLYGLDSDTSETRKETESLVSPVSSPKDIIGLSTTSSPVLSPNRNLSSPMVASNWLPNASECGGLHSTPRACSKRKTYDSHLYSPKAVIDLTTPYSLQGHSKRAKVIPEIIDITDSPLIVDVDVLLEHSVEIDV